MHFYRKLSSVGTNIKAYFAKAMKNTNICLLKNVLRYICYNKKIGIEIN